MLASKLLSKPSISDPHWNNVTLYVKVNNGVVADVSPSPKSLTLSGNTVVSSAATLFGEQSIYFDGSGDFITAASALYINGTSSYTIDFWVQQLTGSAGQILTSGGNDLNLFHSNVLGVWTGVSTNQVTNQVIYGAWNHYAIVRNGSTVTVYLNGVSMVTFSNSQSYTSMVYYLMRNSSNSNQSNGYVHSLRITNGVARYTGNFTVPSSPFPMS